VSLAPPPTLEARYRKVALPLVSLAPRVPGMIALVRGSATMYTDESREPFAAGVFLYADGELVWEREARGLDYGHPAEIRVPPVDTAARPGLLFVYVTRQAFMDGAAAPRVPGYEESWVFLVSAGAGETAVSVPSVPYIGSRKKGIDHKYQCFAGLRLQPGHWRSIAWIMNPYPDPLELRAWLQATGGASVEVAGGPVPGRSVRELDLAQLAGAAGDAGRFDYGTLVVWGSLKPQGYVAVQTWEGRTRAMDHFNPFWS
jgi:hypothetical protein